MRPIRPKYHRPSDRQYFPRRVRIFYSSRLLTLRVDDVGAAGAVSEAVADVRLLPEASNESIGNGPKSSVGDGRSKSNRMVTDDEERGWSPG